MALPGALERGRDAFERQATGQKLKEGRLTFNAA
jgi:hypothetical protein